MRARFIGDPRHNGDGPAVVHLYGVDFPKGEWVGPIPAVLEMKLPNHSHFETDGGESQKAPVSAPEPAPVPVAVQEPEPAPAPVSEPAAPLPTELQPDPNPFNGADPAAFDHDGDGEPGGSVPSDERAAVMAQLDAMKVPYDRRLGLPRLKAALEVAQFERGED